MKSSQNRVGAAGRRLPFIVLALLAAAPAACLGWNADLDPPDASTGDIVFYVDIVTFYDGPDRNVEEIYCIVPNEQLKFLERDQGFSGKLKYTVGLVDSLGRNVESTEKTVDVYAPSADEATDKTVVQVLQSKLSVAPGRYRVKVLLTDLNARKRTILSYIFKRYRRGEADVAVDSRPFDEGRVSISDIEFARSVTRKPEGDFQKSGYEIIPNPQRRFGLLLPEMAVFFEVYDLRALTAADSVLATYSIVAKDGRTVFRNEVPMWLRGPRSAATAVFDLTSLTGGGYALDITLRDRAGEVLASADRKFDVAWSSLSWGRYERENLQDMAFILTEKEMKAFEALSAGEQERFLVDFWRPLDPTPGTPNNEAMAEHYRRVAYADQHYGTAGVRGAMTDRGKIYIKYGPADDVQSYFSDYEFIRDKRDMEGGDEMVPVGPFTRVGIATGTESGDEASSDQRGGTTVHGKPYETWTYDGPGDPVRRLADRLASSAGMRFMFVDERGIGDFKMVYSSEKVEY
jgi:GWxTD domain-containing protein